MGKGKSDFAKADKAGRKKAKELDNKYKKSKLFEPR